MAEMKGLGGDVASCRGLLGNGSSRRSRGPVVVGRDLREFSMHEGRGGAATSCRSLPENSIDMGDGRGCREMPGCVVEEGKGEYCPEFSWSAGEW
jgi:hypothetical protein